MIIVQTLQSDAHPRHGLRAAASVKRVTTGASVKYAIHHVKYEIAFNRPKLVCCGLKPPCKQQRCILPVLSPARVIKQGAAMHAQTSSCTYYMYAAYVHTKQLKNHHVCHVPHP